MFDPEENMAIEAEIEALLDSMATELHPSTRKDLAGELRKKVERSTDPGAVITDYLQERYPIAPGQRFEIPSADLDDRAMNLLEHQVETARASLKLIRDRKLSCSHETLTASDSSSSKIFTRQEIARQALEDIDGVYVSGAELTESNGAVEAMVQAQMVSFYSEGMDPEIQANIEDALRQHILSATEPSTVLRRRLIRYLQTDGSVMIPPSERIDQAIHTLTVQLNFAHVGLGVIADRKLSCEDHELIYAGNVVSQGNLIFTPQKIAANSLETMEGFRLKRIHLEPLAAPTDFPKE